MMAAPDLRPPRLKLYIPHRARSGEGDGRASPVLHLGVDRHEADIIARRATGLLRVHVRQHRPPGIDSEAVAKGRAPVGVRSRLRRRDDMTGGFDRPGAEQGVPMRLAGRHGKGGRDRDQFGATVDQCAIDFGKTQIITDRKAQPAERRIDEDDGVAALTGWRNDVFGKDAVLLRNGDLAIALENGEAVVVELMGENE